MKKLAFFVEGLTEQLFVKELLTEIAGAKNITIEDIKFSSSKDKSKLFQIIGKSNTGNSQYYVLVIDCSNDSRVQSAVIESHEKLVKNGYSKILGLRDIYPKTHTDLPAIKRVIKYGIPTKPIPTDILLAVTEIESWFMAEYLHFEKIDSRLTHSLIKTNFLHDLINDNVEMIIHPSAELHKIYSSVGKKYAKKTKTISRTVKSLDYSHIYLTLIGRVNHLKTLIGHIESFLS
ncbi:MAG: hypothetical protein ABUT20_58960 [Bacteroidota bacterium]